MQGSWQQELARAVRDPLELLALLDLTPEQIGPGETAASLLAAAEGFALRVPRGYIGRMRRGDPQDPLLRQVLPVGAERLPVAGYVADPLGEQADACLDGLGVSARVDAMLAGLTVCLVSGFAEATRAMSLSD